MKTAIARIDASNYKNALHYLIIQIEFSYPDNFPPRIVLFETEADFKANRLKADLTPFEAELSYQIAGISKHSLVPVLNTFQVGSKTITIAIDNSFKK